MIGAVPSAGLAMRGMDGPEEEYEDGGPLVRGGRDNGGTSSGRVPGGRGRRERGRLMQRPAGHAGNSKDSRGDLSGGRMASGSLASDAAFDAEVGELSVSLGDLTVDSAEDGVVL